MLDNAIQVNAFLIQYCRTLVEDLADERLTEQPHEGINHPAWILGHLAWAADGVLAMLGSQRLLPDEWKTLFGSGSKPLANRALYPSKEELLRAVEQGYLQGRQKAASASPEQLARPTTHARAKPMLPTAQEFIAFLMTGHVGVHVGQLSSWRRLIGLPPLF